MTESWVRYDLTAELLSDAHLGSGSGGGGIDALVARDRHGCPVIWASHLEGVLRDAARRLRGEDSARSFFGAAGGHPQRAIFTSLYTRSRPESHVWRGSARERFDNRAPKDDTLRVVEHVPRGTKFMGQIEIPANDVPILQRLLQEVDALGGGRATGAGRVRLSIAVCPTAPRALGDPTGRIVLLLSNRDPLCITATATPDNLIRSLAFVPGRTLLGALAAWLLADGRKTAASLLTSARISVSDMLPVPIVPTKLSAAEVLPAPLALQSRKPPGSAGELPWWAEPIAPQQRLDSLGTKERLKRPGDDLFVYRSSAQDQWTTFRPLRQIHLRNGRPDPNQVEPSLFAIEQIAEQTCFLATISGGLGDMKSVADALAPVLDGRRWLRVGRAGAPVEVQQIAWAADSSVASTIPAQCASRTLLTLTSDLLSRDDDLRWQSELDEGTLQRLVGTDALRLAESLQDSVPVHGFNGTSRLWRMPATAIRRGSVFELSGAGVARLIERAAAAQWLGERTHEGFGRFRLDAVLPGVTGKIGAGVAINAADDASEEAIAAAVQLWSLTHAGLANRGSSTDRKPSLSQWVELVSELERGVAGAIDSRLAPEAAGARTWLNSDARAVLSKLQDIPTPEQRGSHARLFVRWLRASMRREHA